jgi:hypothetical protein
LLEEGGDYLLETFHDDGVWWGRTLTCVYEGALWDCAAKSGSSLRSGCPEVTRGSVCVRVEWVVGDRGWECGFEERESGVI